MTADFAPVYAELRGLVLRATPYMVVSKDGPTGLELLAPWAHPRNTPMRFGAVRPGTAYVSVHLMPLYMNPALQARVPPGLKGRTQGKARFNFRTIDPNRFAELEDFARTCAKAYKTRLSSNASAVRVAAAGLLDEGARASGVRLAKGRFHLVGRHRAGEPIALHAVAA